MIVVLDYCMGNLRSVEKAVQHLGYDVSVQQDLQGAEKLILPGVGAFGAAMERLADLRNDIAAFVAGGAPMLGICLGEQLLFETSEEMGEHRGLGLLPGTVKYLPKTIPGVKVPHMGWNALETMHADGPNAGLQPGDQVYFVHSLAAECDPSLVAAYSTHGIRFPATVMRGNVWGTQFHPEKSGDVGLRILRNFLSC